MEELLKFLKEQKLYKEEFFKLMEGKIKVLPYDDNFMAVSNYVIKNEISKKKEKSI